MKRSGKQMKGGRRQASREPDHKHPAWETNYTTVNAKQFVFCNIKTRACDVQSWETKDCKAEAATAAQSWETSVKDCKAKTDTAVQSGRTHLKKELRSPDSNPFGELFFKCEHDAG